MPADRTGDEGLLSPVLALESPFAAGVAELIAASDAFSLALYPPESCFGVPIEALAEPNVRFFVARLGDAAVGCGGYAVSLAGWAEVKRLFVADSARGQRLGVLLMQRIEAAAMAEGIDLLRLETGVDNVAALRLYRSFGYVETGPFGDYGPDPTSVFMEKRLG